MRAIATNTVRQLRQPQNFLIPAEAALGHDIEVVSGREEARLIYLGVAHGNPPHEKRRLVIDIGGGSTEFIIGDGFEAIERESLQMGCIATTRRFFADGKLSRKRWKEAKTEITAEFQQFGSTYRKLGWQEVFGSSGTIKAIGEVAAAMKLTRGSITDCRAGNDPRPAAGLRKAGKHPAARVAVGSSPGHRRRIADPRCRFLGTRSQAHAGERQRASRGRAL